MPQWVVWYHDGYSFNSEEGAPHEAPRWGVLCIAAYSADHGRVIWHGGDYYCHESGEWGPRDLVGLIDYLTEPGAEKVVLVGRHVPPKQFWAVYEQANTDPRLPPRSSYSALEKPRP